jgi:hypothetical protein
MVTPVPFPVRGGRGGDGFVDPWDDPLNDSRALRAWAAVLRARDAQAAAAVQAECAPSECRPERAHRSPRRRRDDGDD